MTSHKVCDKGDFPFNLNERTDVSPANRDCICLLNISYYSVHPLSLSLNSRVLTDVDLISGP